MKEKNRKAKKNNSDLYDFEQSYWQNNQIVCGVDEVGRGCLAGPIVTAAVILNPNKICPEIKDSKLLQPRQIENIAHWIRQNSSYAIGISNARIIDSENIYKATQISMKKAILHVLHSTDKKPSIIAIDAMPLNLHNNPYEQIPVVSWTQGESKSASIAAASIIAKATRDAIMQTMGQAFPAFALQNHKGYGTKAHTTALQTYQASIIHRKTFIKNIIKAIDHEPTEQQNLFC